MQLAQTTLAETQPVFLLRIDFYGKIIGVASYPLTYDDQEYTGGLVDFVFEEKSELLGLDLQSNAFSTAVYIDGMNVIEEWRRGRGFEGLTATVSYVLSRKGVIIDESEQVILSGLIQQPVFGDPEMHTSFVSFSVERKPIDAGKPIIDADESIDKVKHPHLDEETASGKFYPTIIGQAGYIRDGDDIREIFATPAYNIKRYNLGSPGHDVYFMVAGHECAAATIKIWDGTKTPISKTLLQGQDVNGKKYSYVNLNSDPFLYPGFTSLAQDAVQPSSFWVTWPDQGGKRNPFGTGVLQGGGDICRWALMTAGIPLDHGAWANAGVILNEYIFAGYINEPVDTWEWLQNNILPYLPIEVKTGEKGVYPVLNQFVALQNVQPVASILQGNDFLQVSAIETSTDTSEIVNACTVSFALNSAKDSYAATTRIAPNSENADGDAQNNFAQSSFNRFGLHEVNLELPFVYERKTAHRIASDFIRARCFAKRTIEYCAAAEYGYLKIGDVITLTDDNLFFDELPCTIVRKAYENTKWYYTLQFEDTPLVIGRHN